MIQKRVDGSTDFWSNWNDYARGFGDPKKNYWAGNDYLNGVSNQPFTPYEVKIDMVATDASKLSASYDKFRVGSADKNYELSLGNFSGTGNGMYAITQIYIPCTSAFRFSHRFSGAKQWTAVRYFGS